MTDQEKIEYCWDEFQNWADNEGVSLKYRDDWQLWWDCWKAAIDAKKEHLGAD